ncbi:MAG: MBL fold metallo-hydrolase [Bacteroidota bacterium]
MEITFLGTGTSQGVPVIGCDCEVCLSEDPRDKRLRCSIMVSINGKNIVVDTGPDFREQMLRAGVKDVEAVLITHEHRDHIAGLDDVRPFNFIHKKDMPVYTTRHVAELLKKSFWYIFDAPFYPGIPQIKLHEINKDDPFTVSGVEITPIEVMHYKLPVLGFRFGGFTYITDAKTIAEEEKLKIKGTKTLVLNALRKEEHISHLNLEQALTLIDELKPERAYLTHASHLLGLHQNIQDELPENVFLAYDGLKISV